jgi:REP element-mobilizing transposase RayT
MARPPRLHVPGGLYHVIARGNDRRQIFHAARDYRVYLRMLASGLQRADAACVAYCLMPNHLHLLLVVGAKPLSCLMQSVQLRYSQYFNRTHGHVGHCFQGRYLAILCDKDAYLLELVRYLHLNPVRSGLVKDPARWRWSSHRAYLAGDRGVKEGEAVGLLMEPVLGQFHKEPRKARAAFQFFAREGVGLRHRADLYRVWDQRVLGGEPFAQAMLRPVRSQPDPPVQIPLETILDAVAGAEGISRAAMTAAGRTRQAARARAVSALIAQEVGGYTLTEAARALCRDVRTISDGIRNLRSAMSVEGKLERQVNGLAARLREGRARRQRCRPLPPASPTKEFQ